MSDHHPDVLNVRVTNLERVVERVSTAVESIDESLKTLTRLDVKHDETRDGLGRAFVAIEDHEKRMRTIESEMPTIKLGRRWIFAGVTGSVAVLVAIIVQLIQK